MGAFKTKEEIYDDIVREAIVNDPTFDPSDDGIFETILHMVNSTYAQQYMYHLWMGSDHVPMSDSSSAGCNHDWKLYTGLREEFHFCTKCQEKK